MVQERAVRLHYSCFVSDCRQSKAAAAREKYQEAKKALEAAPQDPMYLVSSRAG